ncbi:hypothetical protein EV182_001808 [Spiromyces aspiralis]|uniref:Uncharacterized protein n=1 Tax=Spiromyces aspiralis TaxID=68401 RepID=A0ACC1HWE4_9FUNG|nr:hypothetical protein EV182_001808 [Spiromyces aspiralis]
MHLTDTEPVDVHVINQALREAKRLGETVGKDPIDLSMKAFGYGTLYCLGMFGTVGGALTWHYQKQGISSLPEFSQHIRRKIQSIMGSVEERAASVPVTADEIEAQNQWQAFSSTVVKALSEDEKAHNKQNS